MITLQNQNQKSLQNEMLPLTMAEINYLCIDKCTLITTTKEFINKKTFDENYKVK